MRLLGRAFRSETYAVQSWTVETAMAAAWINEISPIEQTLLTCYRASHRRHRFVNLAQEKIGDRRAGAQPGEPVVRVLFDADRIGREVRAGHERVGLFIRPIALHLKLHLVPIGIGVIHRHRTP